MRDLALEVDAGRLAEQEAAIKVAEHIQTTLNCMHVTFWTVSGELGSRVMRHYAAYDGLRKVAVTSSIEFPEAGGGYFNTLVSAGCYVCSNAFEDPKLVGVRDTMLVTYNIRSLLAASYGLNGDIWGIITLTDNVVRKWLPSEITALRRCAAEISVRSAKRRKREKIGHIDS